MIGNLSVRRGLTVIGLAVVWCALWQDISFANVAGGLLLGVVITALGVGSGVNGAIRPVPLAKLVAVVFADLVSSTINVAIEVITPTDRTNESIIGISLPAHAKDHMLLLVVAITLTPGTAVVDANPDEAMIFVHLLHDEQRASTIAHAERLAELAHQALPVSSAGVVS